MIAIIYKKINGANNVELSVNFLTIICFTIRLFKYVVRCVVLEIVWDSTKVYIYIKRLFGIY